MTVRGGVLATLLVMGACSGEEAAREPEPTGGAEESQSDTERTLPPALEHDPLDPDSACGRAEACCRAFAAAIPNVVAESACVGPREVHERADADVRCDAMRAGWREALTLQTGEAPDACR